MLLVNHGRISSLWYVFSFNTGKTIEEGPTGEIKEENNSYTPFGWDLNILCKGKMH